MSLMDKKIIVYGIVIVLVLLLMLVSFGVIRIKGIGKEINSNSADAGNYDNLPEKCRPTAGQDIKLWKEHLSHHAQTQDCLKYFN